MARLTAYLGRGRRAGGGPDRLPGHRHAEARASYLESGEASYFAAREIVQSDSVLVAGAVGQGASFALAFGFVLISLNAMRVGLLTRFMGILGVIVGVLLAIPQLAPTPIVLWFWLGALAFAVRRALARRACRPRGAAAGPSRGPRLASCARSGSAGQEQADRAGARGARRHAEPAPPPAAQEAPLSRAAAGKLDFSAAAAGVEGQRGSIQRGEPMATGEREPPAAGGLQQEAAIDWEAAERSPEFRQLIATRRRFVAAGHDLLLRLVLRLHRARRVRARVHGPVDLRGPDVGYALALSQFVMTWGLGYTYLRRADRDFDPLAKAAADRARQGGSGSTDTEARA